jgi:hypothetical protein
MARVPITAFACLSLCLALAGIAAAQAPAAGAPGPRGEHFECSIGITQYNSRDVHTLGARLKSPEACKSWGADTAHLDDLTNGYQLQVHDEDGKLVLKQVCHAKGLPLFGNGESPFVCKDAT